MTNLKAIEGMNKFCGPAVLAILTGKSTDECAMVISSINGKYTIEGVYLKDLLTAADRLGFDCEAVTPAGSLYGTLTRLVSRDGMYIVTLPKHFVAIEVNDKQIYFCDNHTKEPVPAAASARLQQRVNFVHRVVKRREPVQIGSRTEVIKKYREGQIHIEIYQHIMYDISKYDRMIAVAKIQLNEREFEDFVKEITREEM